MQYTIRTVCNYVCIYRCTMHCGTEVYVQNAACPYYDLCIYINDTNVYSYMYIDGWILNLQVEDLQERERERGMVEGMMSVLSASSST